MWGAKSGKEQLPPFPEPTFAAGFACGVPRAATECVVGFQSVDAFDKAHQMVRVLNLTSYSLAATALLPAVVCAKSAGMCKDLSLQYCILLRMQPALFS